MKNFEGDMRRIIACMLALAFVSSLAPMADAQQRRPYPQRGAQYPQSAAQRGGHYAPRVASRPRTPGDRGPAVALPKEKDVVKQEITGTVISQVVLGGLKRPTAVAIQPKSGELFIAEAGAGRIGRLNDVPGSYDILSVIDGFSADGDSENSGLQNIAFADKYTLIVATGEADGQSAVQVYRIPPAGSIEAGDLRSVLDVAPEGQPLAARSLALAWIDDKLFLAGRGASRGFLTDIQWNDDGQNACHLLTKRPGEVNSPTAMTQGPRGELLVANMGGSGDQTDSTLLIFDIPSSEARASVAVGLRDLVAVALSPRTRLLYGLERTGGGSQPGGLYRLDVKEDEGELICVPARLMTLNQPTAMAFAPDGTLFIVTDASHAADHEGGLLVRIYNESQL
jgi:glucose/arabinose dehydrogenase